MTGHFWRIFLSLMIIVISSSAEAFFGFSSGPQKDLWPRWTRHDPTSTEVIDHRSWDLFLSRNLVVNDQGVGRIAYGQVSAEDRAILDRYIVQLTQTPITQYNQDQQLAYWINLYNAVTVQIVIAYYPVESIRDINISPGWFSVGPWGKKVIDVEDESLSLNDIEHRILRPIWNDPRIHYAVNCASVGCPNLQSQAFTAQLTDSLLDVAAKEYINSPRGVHIRDGEIYVSKIYQWFEEDFGSSEQGVIAHLLSYADPMLAHSLRTIGQISGYAYDWSLNEVLE